MQRVKFAIGVLQVLLLIASCARSGPLLAEEVDLLAVTHDFRTLPRNLIVVVPVPQPSKDAGKLETADSLGRVMTEALVESLQRELPSATVVALSEAVAQTDGLIVDARFSKLVPGSRAKRFWVGFGAGKSVTEVSGEVRERTTGRVVARFTQAHLSWCCGYGSNDQEVRSNLVSTAGDIASVVAAKFYPKQTIAWIEDERGASPAPQAPTKSVPKGILVIDASSEHAEVSVDDGFVGTTKLEVGLSEGIHRVVVKKRGFKDWERGIQIVDGGRQSLWADLEEARAVPASVGGGLGK